MKALASHDVDNTDRIIPLLRDPHSVVSCRTLNGYLGQQRR